MPKPTDVTEPKYAMFLLYTYPFSLKGKLDDLSVEYLNCQHHYSCFGAIK